MAKERKGKSFLPGVGQGFLGFPNMCFQGIFQGHAGIWLSIQKSRLREMATAEQCRKQGPLCRCS